LPQQKRAGIRRDCPAIKTAYNFVAFDPRKIELLCATLLSASGRPGVPESEAKLLQHNNFSLILSPDALNLGRVEDGRGGLSLTAFTPFPVPAHQTGRADLRIRLSGWPGPLGAGVAGDRDPHRDLARAADGAAQPAAQHRDREVAAARPQQRGEVELGIAGAGANRLQAVAPAFQTS
jgi:hypothetical protein